MTFGTGEEGKLLQLRDESLQKIDVIPYGRYPDEEKNLTVENQARVPVWWIKQDEEEHGELIHFDLITKQGGRKKKVYWVCKIPYGSKAGFDYEKRGKVRSPVKII